MSQAEPVPVQWPRMRTVHVTAIIAAGGRGTRFGAERPKQLLEIAGVPMLQRSTEAFLSAPVITDVIVALPADLMAHPPAYLVRDRVRLVCGGARRQDSVAAALALAQAADLVVVHDAARPFVSGALIARVVACAQEHGAAIAAIAAKDTVKRRSRDGAVVGTLDRSEIALAQTPQAFRREVLEAALEKAGAVEVTDEAMWAERAGYTVKLVEGDPRNMKVTTPEDAELAEAVARHGQTTWVTRGLRIGNGYDLHRLVAGRPLILGGVQLPFEKGLLGHSDADAVCHAVTDAVLGAAGCGDIGRHFPDTDPAWKDADSLALLRGAMSVVRAAGFAVVNVDVTVVAERPKLAPHVDAMRANVAAALDVAASQVSVKGKTNEGVDSMGAGESIAVHAVALLARR